MVSLIGAHYSRNGIKQFPARVILSMYSNGLGGDETHPDTITILRDTRIFPSGEAPPDFHTFDPETSGVSWEEYGRYWYSERQEMTIHPDGTDGFRNFRDAWNAGQPANYYTICNEQGGGEGNTPEQKEEIRRNVQRLVDIERAISKAANTDGRKCCVGNFAGGSPGDFELWKEIVAPFIVEAWQNGGNIYGRHCYAEEFIDAQGNVKPGQPQRVIDELEYLRSIGYGGGVVLTECGLDGGYGVANLARFTYQIQAWEAALRPYSDILIGFCVWECGDTGFHADYTDHLKTLIPYMQNSYLGRWEPAGPQQPPDGGGGEPVTTEIKTTVTYGTIEGRIKVRPQRWDSTLKNWVATGPAQYLDLPAGTKRIAIDDEVEVDKPTDPNPPPVVMTLPRGSKGVDLSAYQKGFFSKVSPDKFDFFMFRCSDGMNTSATSNYHDANGIDTALLEFADVGHASGKPWGIYHFLRPNNIEAQISKVRAICQVLVDRGTPPRAGKFEDGAIFAGIWADVEDYSLTNAIVKQFVAGVGIVSTTGIYTGKYVWESVTAGADVWWSNKPLWLAAYGANNGQVPPWTSPSIPRGWTAVNVWQYTSEGQLVITEWPGDGLDLNSAGPYAPATPPPPPPPTGATVDTLPYFVPSGAHGRYMVMHFNDGRTQPQQLERRGDMVYLWKGEGCAIDGIMVYDYESWGVDLKKWIDTSDQGNNGRDAYNLNGAVWLPRFVEVGKVYVSTPTVKRFDRITCKVISQLQTTDYLYIKALYPTWVSPKNQSITLEDVLLIEWRKTPDINTPPLESYYLAPNMCYCAWQDGAVGELPEGRQPLSFQLTNC